MYQLGINFLPNQRVYDLAAEQYHKLYRVVYQLPMSTPVDTSGLISNFDDAPAFFNDKTTIRFINEEGVARYVVLEDGVPVDVYAVGAPTKENEQILVHITKTIPDLDQIGVLLFAEDE